MARTYLGLDLRSRQVGAAALRRHGREATLIGGRIAALPDGVVVPSLRQQNVRDRGRLAAILKDVLHPLAGSEERLALALPDAAGSLLLTEVEPPLRSKREGEEVLRWQLRSRFGGDMSDLLLDFQVLEEREEGRQRVAVAIAARSVVAEYEDLLAELGYHALILDFHALQLYNFYRPRLDLGSDTVMVAVEDGALSLQYFEGQKLAFQRCREIGVDLAEAYREINRSVVGGLESCPGLKRAQVFLHSDWVEIEPLREMVRSIFDREPALLDPHVEKLAGAEIALGAARVRGLVAAIGAAERLLP
jgi:type IV pilus assembly protein PilM